MFVLHPHPATPCPAVQHIRVQVRRAPGGQGWCLRYVLTGDVARLRLPAPSAQPAAVDGLWQRTCFEAFAARAGEAAYREFNLSPSGDWAAYAFDSERSRAANDTGPHSLAATLAATQPPRIRCCVTAEATPHQLRLIAHLPDAALGAGPWQLGLSAVIAAQDGGLSYWALHHPAPRPDFHARSGWTGALPPPKDHMPKTP